MKDIFKRLPQEKQDRVLMAFLEEFASNDYENASITLVVKELGIAKGSVYQYFGSKMELYQTLRGLCLEERANYEGGLNKDEFWDYWDYFKEVYSKRVRFELERPVHSQLLYRGSQDRSNAGVESLVRTDYLQELAIFTEAIREEQKEDTITKKLDAHFIAFSIMAQCDLMRAYLETGDGYKPGSPEGVFEGAEEAVEQYIDQCIAMFKEAYSR